MTTPAQTRALIEQLLFDLRRPMTSTEISEVLAFRTGVCANTLSVGVNLGYLRVGGKVARKKVIKWGGPYFYQGLWRVNTETWWWHKSLDRGPVMRFLANVRREVEMKLMTHQRSRGKPVTYRLPPRTDDMRQMLVDLQHGGMR